VIHSLSTAPIAAPEYVRDFRNRALRAGRRWRHKGPVSPRPRTQTVRSLRPDFRRSGGLGPQFSVEAQAFDLPLLPLPLNEPGVLRGRVEHEFRRMSPTGICRNQA